MVIMADGIPDAFIAAEILVDRYEGYRQCVQNDLHFRNGIRFQDFRAVARGGRGGRDAARSRLPVSLVSGKDKQLIANDVAACRRSELIEGDAGFGRDLAIRSVIHGEWIAGVE